MKKLISTVIVALGLIILIAPTKPADAQVYCGACCGMINGVPTVGCTLVAAIPCGNACWCTNVPGQGYAC